MNNYLDRILSGTNFDRSARFGDLNVGALFRTSSGDNTTEYTFIRTDEDDNSCVFLRDGETTHFPSDKQVYVPDTYEAINMPNPNRITIHNGNDMRTTTVTTDGRVTTRETKIEKSEENNMFGVNFEFGKVSGSEIKMTAYGLAFVGADGRLSAYNIETKQLTDVTELALDFGDGMVFQMPCAVTDLKSGDIIKHNGQYVVVDMEASSAEGATALTAVHPIRGEIIMVIPKTNLFGFNYVTKVVNLMGNMMGSTTATAENPFGNLMPMMMLSSLSGEGKGKGDNDMMKTMMMMSMMGGENPFGNLMGGTENGFNPMMMMMLMK